jgi:hypothetical protein
MADQEITVPMDDKELFAAAIEEVPKEAEETQEVTEQPRDEQGRFAKQEATDAAPTQPEPAEQPTEQPEAKEEANVPSWRLREVREAREAAERREQEATRQAYALHAQLQAMQRELAQLRAPKQEPVDFFANPEQALEQQFEQRRTPIEQRFAQMEGQLRLNSSKAIAIATHGGQAVVEMEQAIAQAMQSGHPEMNVLAAQMRTSDDPVSVAMQWYQRDKLLKETGGDISNYRTKLEGDLLKNPEFRAKAMEAWRTEAQSQPGTRPAINLPPSLNRATGSGGNLGQDDGDMSNEALYSHAISGGRR